MGRRKAAFLLVLAMFIPVITLPWWNRASASTLFLGDSLTQGWHYPRLNAGRYGETSEKILRRFPTNMNARGIHTIHILAGTNDVLLKLDLDKTAANLEDMVRLARQQNVEPVVATIPPIHAENDSFLPAVQSLNERIRTLAGREHLCLVDYYSALDGHPKFQSDGIHMKKLGYAAMEYELLKDKKHCN